MDNNILARLFEGLKELFGLAGGLKGWLRALILLVFAGLIVLLVVLAFDKRLSGEQVLILLLASLVAFLVIAYLIAAPRKPAAQAVGWQTIRVLVHTPKGLTFGIAGARVVTSLHGVISQPTNDKGETTMDISAALVRRGEKVEFRAERDGQTSQPVTHALSPKMPRVEIEWNYREPKPAAPLPGGPPPQPGSGAGSVDIHGSANGATIITGSYNVVNSPSKDLTVNSTALRASYLSQVFNDAQTLNLAGIDSDSKDSDESAAQVNLQAVYTALLTLTPDEAREMLKPGKVHPDVFRHCASALKQLNKNKRLVLLGDPGSGKSTFVNFVALCLAGQALEHPQANLDLLRAPLLPDEEEEQSEPQPWEHGALLPLKLVLRDFAARGLPSAERKAGLDDFWKFLANEWKDSTLAEFLPVIKKELLEQGGIFLVDGLDEVPEAEQCRVQIKQVVEAFAAAYPKCLVLVTSRTYAYQKQDWKLTNFTEAVLAPFSRGQIAAFVDRWYACMAPLRKMSAEEAQGSAGLLKKSIFERERLLELAERPLLLTLMASLHVWHSGDLPEKRQLLYEETVELLLNRWERRRVIREHGRESSIEPGLSEWLKVRDREEVRGLLERLAFEAHAGQIELAGTADVLEDNLLLGLMKLNRNPDVNQGILRDYLVQRAGLLLPRGEGIYTFPHRTLQEYLAACFLTRSGYPGKLARLACEDVNRWREVVLLAGAKVETPYALWALVDSLSPEKSEGTDCSKELQSGSLIAGQALAESARLEEVEESDQPKLARVQTRLVTILQKNDLPALERALAGDTLAQLGDPRFDPNLYYLPKEDLLGFVRIPAGEFLMGSDKEKDSQAYDDELPQHTVALPEYFLARCPVTVAQYRAFVEQSKYKKAHERSLQGLSNHPVVYVSWYDALEYTKWLTGALKKNAKTPGEVRRLLDAGWRVSLPSEAEWEKGARGGLSPVLVGKGDEERPDGRIYPWGDRFDPERANTSETGLGRTSAVGCFSGADLPYGLLDMTGNVWEWTRSNFKPYPYDPLDGRERLDGQGGSYVRRGGAFGSNRGFARCAFRYYFPPDLIYSFLGFRVVLSPSPS